MVFKRHYCLSLAAKSLIETSVGEKTGQSDKAGRPVAGASWSRAANSSVPSNDNPSGRVKCQRVRGVNAVLEIDELISLLSEQRIGSSV